LRAQEFVLRADLGLSPQALRFRLLRRLKQTAREAVIAPRAEIAPPLAGD